MTARVGANSKEELEEYTQNYYYLLAAFYTTNKLKLNGEKTKLMMVADQRNPISIVTEKNETLTCDNQVKILGWWSNTKNSMDTHVARIKAAVHYQALLLKPAMNFLSLDQRRVVINAKILPKNQVWDRFLP